MMEREVPGRMVRDIGMPEWSKHKATIKSTRLTKGVDKA
jgi:hypothetical protein